MRKTFKAGPFRATISKSGISCSASVKGARITKKANGNIMTTTSLPGTGISYSKEYSSKKKTKNTKKVTSNVKNDSKNSVGYISSTGTDFTYIPDPDFKDVSTKIGFGRQMKITGGALLRFISFVIFGILAFNAGPWIMFFAILWALHYSIKNTNKYTRPYESFKKPVDFKDFDDGKTPKTFFGLITHLTDEQLMAYADIIKYCDSDFEKQFSIADLNVVRNEEQPISRYMLDKLYELGFILKPARGKYSLNVDKLEYYAQKHLDMEKENMEKYNLLVRSCEDYNKRVHERNIILAEKRK